MMMYEYKFCPTCDRNTVVAMTQEYGHTEKFCPVCETSFDELEDVREDRETFEPCDEQEIWDERENYYNMEK